MRRIIVACDGTGNSSVRGKYKISSNISRLCHALDMDGDAQQIVFYQSGIGTANYGWSFQNLAQGTGLGIDDNVLDAYQFIANNYLPGDEIFIFGFSRGAYTARILANFNFIVRFGILRTRFSWALKDVWNGYIQGKAGFEKAIAQVDEYSRKYDAPGKERRQRVNVKVCGCFDTVGSVKDGEFYDASLVTSKDDKGNAYRIENAFHALALDECRRLFTPTLWYKTEDDKDTNLEQTWFSGAHTNVGGGYTDQICADMSLLWMIDRCSPFLAFDPEYIQENVIHLDHFPNKIASRHRASKRRTEYVDWGLGQIEDSYNNGVQRLQGWKYRQPNEYGASPADDQEGKLSIGTMEKIHPSVRIRWKNTSECAKKYPTEMPDALEGFSPVQRDGKWVWVKPAVKESWVPYRYAKPEVVIPEEEFTGDQSRWEWILRHGRKSG